MTPLPHLGGSAGMLARLSAGGRSDIFNLYAARAARGFGDGFAAIILPAYLLELGFNPFEIGVVATAALLGSAATTLAIGRAHAAPGLCGVDDRHGHRDPQCAASRFHRRDC